MSPLQNVYGDLALDATLQNALIQLVALNATVSSLDLNTDGIETLAAAANALATTLNAQTDGLEGLATTSNATAASILAAVDTLEALATTLNSQTDGLEGLATTLNAQTDTLEALQAAGNALLTTIAANMDPLVLGTSMYRNINVLNTGVVIKATPGKIYTIHACNDVAADRYLKIYNKVAAPTAADTPVMTIPLLETDSPTIIALPFGLDLSLGIGIRATTAIADADNGAPGANDVIVNIGYR